MKKTIKLLIISTLMLLGITNAAEMNFKTIPNNATTSIYAEGEITNSTPQKFQNHLKTIEEGLPNIIFNSTGGSLIAGLKLGELIRKNNVSTTIGQWKFENKGYYVDKTPVGPGACLSACALAFMGGIVREANPGTIGFHQFYGNLEIKGAELLSTAQIISALVAEYLRTMGAHPTLFEKMSHTISTNMFIPNRRQISEMNIVTPTSFKNFTLEPRNGQIVARSLYSQNSRGFQRVSEVEAFCAKGVRLIRLYTDDAKRGLYQSFVDDYSTNGKFEVLTSDGTMEYGPKFFSLHVNQRILATIALQPHVAQSLAKGASSIRFNSGSASGVLLGAEIGMDGFIEPALEAIFNSCQ